MKNRVRPWIKNAFIGALCLNAGLDIVRNLVGATAQSVYIVVHQDGKREQQPSDAPSIIYRDGVLIEELQVDTKEKLLEVGNILQGCDIASTFNEDKTEITGIAVGGNELEASDFAIEIHRHFYEERMTYQYVIDIIVHGDPKFVCSTKMRELPQPKVDEENKQMDSSIYKKV